LLVDAVLGALGYHVPVNVWDGGLMSAEFFDDGEGEYSSKVLSLHYPNFSCLLLSLFSLRLSFGFFFLRLMGFETR